jgi:UDP-glucose 4,6-dehydratase
MDTLDYVPTSILLTGGAGFIGSNTALRILREYPDYKVVVLDKMDYCASTKNLTEAADNPNFKFIKGDICSSDLVSFIMRSEKIDTVMNFAAQTHVDNSFGNSITFTQNNIIGTHVLLEAARHMGGQIRRFIHVSTDEVYGENDEEAENEGQFDEAKTQMCPTNPYAATKAGAEMLVNSYKISYKLPTIITRGNNVYGPRQFPEKLIPKFIHLAMQGRPFTVHGDGGQQRSYMYVEDVAKAFTFVLHKGTVGEVYNIGTLHERNVMSVAKDICKRFDLDEKKQIVHVRDRLFNDARYWMCNKKLRALGWEEETTWEEGMNKTVEWYKANIDQWPKLETALSAHQGEALDTNPQETVEGTPAKKARTE